MLNKIIENIPVNGTKECSFDTEQFPIRDFLANQFKCKSNNLEQQILGMPKYQVNKEGHDLFEKKEFLNSFKLVLDKLESIYGPIAHQKQPTFRFQLNSERSVPFHTDDISSGHPNNIINIWIPITNLNYENTLHFVSAEDSQYLKERFIRDKLSINQMDELARNISSPWMGSYGKLVIFSNKTLHGTVVNNSKNLRISVDFRILPLTKDIHMGKKFIGRDYIIHNNNLRKKDKQNIKNKNNATSVVYCNNKVSNLSHSMQRSIINSFAEINSFQITREAAEWQVEHYPTISEIIEEHPNIPILIATELSFDLSIERTKNLIQKLSNHPAGAYFCLENKKI